MPARPVAITMNESLVEVSPSTVMQLKDSSAASRTNCLQQRFGDAGVGGHEAKHGRHVRLDHAGALADAGNGHRSCR